MAVNRAYFLHRNCCRLTRLNYPNAFNITKKYTLAHNYHTYQRRYCLFGLETWQNRHVYAQGVAFRQPLNELILRCSSTDVNADGELSRIQKLRKLLSNFYLGFKHLFHDVKLTWKIRRKLHANDWNYDILERKELWKMFKTQKNIKKTLPIVALTLLPVIGYLGPIIGFLRPRKFLSTHFWTAKQKEKFAQLDSKEREICNCSIFQIINEETKKLENEEQQLLHNITARVDIKDVDIDSMFAKSFSAFSTGIFSLENLQRMHLQKLCSFWIMRSFWPSFMLKKHLRNEMLAIHKDDIAIFREGVETLSEKHMREACQVRGLNTTNLSSADLQIWLHSWVALTKDISENETSFLAHHAVFKTVNSPGNPEEIIEM